VGQFLVRLVSWLGALWRNMMREGKYQITESQTTHRAQGDDFRTFLADFVSCLPQTEGIAGLNL
jgi:hypothetical protein